MITFIQSPLEIVDLGGAKFNLLLAMIYFNSPRKDEAQHVLAYELREKFLEPGGTCIPNRVRYHATPCAWPEQDSFTRAVALKQHIQDAQMLSGLSLRKVEEAALARAWGDTLQGRLALTGLGMASIPRVDNHGRLPKSGCCALGERTLYVDIKYDGPRVSYPARVHLDIKMPGVLNTLVWVQELMYDDTLIFSNESISWVRDAPFVRAGDNIDLLVNDGWRRTNTLEIR